MRNKLRIIGGYHKGRKIQFTSSQDLRPTSDRLRETLFNWLGDNITDANCLDAFAGTGIIGMEALSRGAQLVTFCERSRSVAKQINLNLQQLPLQPEQHYQLFIGDSCQLLPTINQSFDIIILDPPFRQATNLIQTCLHVIEQYQLLASHGMVYLEMPQDTDLQTLINDRSVWSIYKHTVSGHVKAALIKKLAVHFQNTQR